LLGGCIIPGANDPASAGADGAETVKLERLRVAPSGLPLLATTGAVPKPHGVAGNLTVLDWAGFKGAVTYTFDDANGSQLAHYDALNALGVPLTFFPITSKPEAADPVWARAVKDGHELGNHSRSHAQAGTGADLDAASDFLKQKFGVTAWTMAAPFGNGSYEELAKTRFLLDRGVSNGLVGPNDDTDPFWLPCYVPPAGAGTAAFDEQIDSARRAGKWRIVLVHGFTGGSDGAYHPVALGAFTASVRHARALGDLWIDSLVNVGAYWRGQKLLSAVVPTKVPTKAGDVQTWSWTLPPHFPPGRFLRVTVDGGTLTQNGQPVAWSEQGFYEIALDAGALTSSP
jgi:peptidoglycan/xylan/chitin deacetylase (PgdA/CDA1 family)